MEQILPFITGNSAKSNPCCVLPYCVPMEMNCTHVPPIKSGNRKQFMLEQPLANIALETYACNSYLALINSHLALVINLK